MGLWLLTSEPEAVQLSEATTPDRTSGTAPWQLAAVEAVTGPGVLVMVGAVVSAIVRTTVVVLKLPAASVTVTVILCVPRPSNVPAVGLWLLISEPEAGQLSEATTPDRTLGTVPWQLASVEAVTGP